MTVSFDGIAGPTAYESTMPALTYDEVSDLLKHAAATVEGTHPRRAEFVPNAITLLDGRPYQDRKRVLMRLFTEAALMHWEHDVLRPAIADVLGRLATAERPQGAPVATDLMGVMDSIFWRLGAQMVGIDGVGGDESALFLQETVKGVKDGFAVDSWVGGDRERRMNDAIAARAHFNQRYIAPSMETRQTMLDEIVRGDRDADDIPTDVISLLLCAGCDDETICSDAISILVGATENNANVIGDCLIHLERWFREHPDDRTRVADEQFLHAAVEEAARLRGSTRLRVRNMTEAGRLPVSGREFCAGEQLVVDFGEANRDPGVFGADASLFDPDRAARLNPRTKPYGVAFGAGRHLCLGRGLALGDARTGRAGLLVPVLAALYSSGLGFDPDTGPEQAPDGKRYERFDVVFQFGRRPR